MLLGSNIQGGLFEDERGQIISLGNIVAGAFSNTNLTEQEWNNLPDDVIETKIKEAIYNRCLVPYVRIKRSYE